MKKADSTAQQEDIAEEDTLKDRLAEEKIKEEESRAERLEKRLAKYREAIKKMLGGIYHKSPVFVQKGIDGLVSFKNNHINLIKYPFRFVIVFELWVSKKYNKEEFFNFISSVNRGLFTIATLITLSVLTRALDLFSIPEILSLVITILSISIGTLSFKYKVDITSLMDSTFNEVDKKKEQIKNIDRYYTFLALSVYNLISLVLQLLFQDYFDKIFVINNYLVSSHSTYITPGVARALWGNALFSHALYIIPGAFAAAIIFYGRNFEIYQQWPDFFDRWSKSSWFTSKNFYNMLVGKRDPWEPYILMGSDMETDSFSFLSPIALANNILIQGPIGVGKSQAIFRPFAYQFYGYFLQYIKRYNRYRRKYKDFEVFKKKFFNKKVSGKMLNGFIMVEPSNDLVSAVYKDLLSAGVPEEMIMYINPKDPNTPGFNSFQGPVDKVVTIVSDILYEFSASDNVFFDNKQKVYLKKMIYLLKLSALFPNELDKGLKGTPTFDSLNDMLDNNILWQRKEILKNYYKVQQDTFEKLKKSGSEVEIRDFGYKLKIAYNVLSFWENCLTQEKNKVTGKIVIKNSQEEYVQGLITVIENISMNFYIKRVFFQDTDFNMDTFYKFGGFLLVNTAVDVMAGDLTLFAKFITVALQNAAFRRPAYEHAMLPSLYDEHPDYINKDFPRYVSQIRKYNAPVIVACQSEAQYSVKEGEAFKNIVFTGLRNKMVFQGVLQDDAEWWSKTFGERFKIVPSYNDGDFDFGNEQVARKGVSYRREKVRNITPSDLVTLGKFVLAAQTSDEGQVKEFVKLQTTPAFELTDTLPKANKRLLKVWWDDYEAQTTFDNKNARDDFAISTDDKETEELISELVAEDRQMMIKSAPVQKLSRIIVANQVKEEEQKQKETYEDSKNRPFSLEDVQKGVFHKEGNEEDERKSLKSILLNATSTLESE